MIGILVTVGSLFASIVLGVLLPERYIYLATFFMWLFLVLLLPVSLFCMIFVTNRRCPRCGERFYVPKGLVGMIFGGGPLPIMRCYHCRIALNASVEDIAKGDNG